MTSIIPLTQGKVTLVDDEDFELVSSFKWAAKKDKTTWYARRNIPTPKGQTTQYLHRFILNVTHSSISVDHRNRNGLDNTKGNLRKCSHAQNCRNQRKPDRATSSKYKGVSFKSETGRWGAQIRKNYRILFLGYFDTELEASAAYNAAALKHYGSFCSLNEIG